MSFWKKMFATPAPEGPERDLYEACVRQSRQPRFFTDWGVSDTLEGRYDMLVVHVYPILRRLKGQGQAADALAQALFDLMFADMDQNLRIMGVGDMGVGRRIKDMAGSLYGRAKAYDEALAEDEETQGEAEALIAAVQRNVFAREGGEGDVHAVAAYLRDRVAVLDAAPLEDLLAGRLPDALDGEGA